MRETPCFLLHTILFLSCCLVFSPVPSFNLLAVWCFFLAGAGAGQGQENDNSHSFSVQIRSAATCAHKHKGMMDERSYTKGANMIHASFVVISPPHICVSAHKSPTMLVFQKCTSFVNLCLYNARWIPPLALCWQQNLLHCLNVNNKKDTKRVQHTASSQSRQVEEGSRRCVCTQTHARAKHLDAGRKCL